MGQISFWVFTVSLADHIFGSERSTRPLGAKVMREDAEEGLCTDSDCVTLLTSEML